MIQLEFKTNTSRQYCCH